MAYEAAAIMIAEALQAKTPAEDRAAREAGTMTRAPRGGVRCGLGRADDA
jgi:hypothetical protein